MRDSGVTFTAYPGKIGDDLRQEVVESHVQSIVVESLPRHYDQICCDYQPDMLNRDDYGIVAYKNFACLAREEVGVKEPHVPYRYSQLELLQPDTHIISNSVKARYS